jgi:hypothetical protein
MPLDEYEDFDGCVRDNQDKRDAEAWCAEAHYQAHGEYPGRKSAEQVHSDPELYVEYALEAMKAAGKNPTEERMHEISHKAQELLAEEEWA